MKDFRRLIFDIETAPNEGWFWTCGYDEVIPHTNITKESSIICISWKFQGEKKVHHLNWDKNHDDKAMLETFIPIMESADEVIGHNHEGFDIRWLRTRCLFHGIDIPPSFVTIDTCKDAKKYFRFNSNSLAYLSRYLNLRNQKLRTEGKDLWKKVVFQDDAEALKEMLQYCDGDVLATEELFERFTPYVKSKSHVGKYRSDCPNCGSDNIRISKQRISAAGTRSLQFQCCECGRYHTVATSRFLADKPI
jgi:DNA polymerase III epsilon subunit-like protein